jgi:acyl-CoA thioester hydrolase
MVSISIDFVAQVKLYDTVFVRTKIIRLGNKSLDMVQDIFNETTGKVVAKSKGVMVGYNGADEASIPIPTRWRERIAAFESDVLF